MKKGDIVIIVVALMSAVVFFLIAGKQKQGGYVHIKANGEKMTYSLFENQTIELKSGSSGFNVVIIQDGWVKVESASCPDKICVRHKAICKNGESIVCLPNEVFIEIESKDQKETDN